jgi:hypothetical protein
VGQRFAELWHGFTLLKIAKWHGIVGWPPPTTYWRRITACGSGTEVAVMVHVLIFGWHLGLLGSFQGVAVV